MECSGPLFTINMSVDGATSNGSWERVSANPANTYWSSLGNNDIEFSFRVPNIPPPCSIAALATTDLTAEEHQNELSIQSIDLIDAEGRKHSQQVTSKIKKVDLDVSDLKKESTYFGFLMGTTSKIIE